LLEIRRQRGGAIVSISSLSGLFGTFFSGLYSARKFTAEGMTGALRFDPSSTVRSAK
jgi:short-subunit dehydrogenase